MKPLKFLLNDDKLIEDAVLTLDRTAYYREHSIMIWHDESSFTGIDENDGMVNDSPSPDEAYDLGIGLEDDNKMIMALYSNLVQHYPKCEPIPLKDHPELVEKLRKFEQMKEL